MTAEFPHSAVITAQALRHLLMCERRVWLDARADPALRDAPAPAALRLYALGSQHEDRVHAATAGPIEPGLMRAAGTPVEAPQVSVMPHTSSIGTPSARYHLTSSGEIGAAPVTRKRAR